MQLRVEANRQWKLEVDVTRLPEEALTQDDPRVLLDLLEQALLHRPLLSLGHLGVNSRSREGHGHRACEDSDAKYPQPPAWQGHQSSSFIGRGPGQPTPHAG